MVELSPHVVIGQSALLLFDGVGATPPLPKDRGAEEFRIDPTVGPRPKVWTRDHKREEVVPKWRAEVAHCNMRTIQKEVS